MQLLLIVSALALCAEGSDAGNAIGNDKNAIDNALGNDNGKHIPGLLQEEEESQVTDHPPPSIEGNTANLGDIVRTMQQNLRRSQRGQTPPKENKPNDSSFHGSDTTATTSTSSSSVESTTEFQRRQVLPQEPKELSPREEDEENLGRDLNVRLGSNLNLQFNRVIRPVRPNRRYRPNQFQSSSSFGDREGRPQSILNPNYYNTNPTYQYDPASGAYYFVSPGVTSNRPFPNANFFTTSSNTNIFAPKSSYSANEIVIPKATPRPTLPPVPTLEPSVAPTGGPTTSIPTQSPTSSPPTQTPTPRPSQRPSRNPTNQPSRSPTRNPTHRPSRSPTREPTRQPTRRPTASPTKQPTPNP